MKTDDLKQKGTKAFMWDFSGKFVSHGMSFIVSIILARLLEPSDFGLIAIIMVIVGIASIFSDTGLGAALIQRKKSHHIHYSSVFYFTLFVSFLLTAITYFSASYIGNFYENKALIPLVQVASLIFILNGLSSVQNIRLSKDLNYETLTKISLTSSFISGLVGISLAFLGAEIWSLIVQILTRSAMHAILIWNNTKWTPKFEFSWKALKQLWHFGFRTFIAGMLDSIFSKLDFLIIGKIYNSEVLGFFQRSKSLNNMVIEYSSSSLMAVLFPLLSNIQNDTLRFQRLIITFLGVIIFTTFFLLGNLYLVSEELIVGLYTEKWLPAVDYFKLLLLSAFGYPVSVILVNVLLSRGKSKEFLRLTIYKKIIFAINLYVGFLYGIDGYLYGLIIVTLISIFLNSIYASRELSLPLFGLLAPVLIQIPITIASVIFTNLIISTLNIESLLIVIFKIITFSITYYLLNSVFKTDALRHFKYQALKLININGNTKNV